MFSQLIGVQKKEEELTTAGVDRTCRANKIIGFNLFRKTELFLERREDLIKIFRPEVIKYLRNYVDRMDYKRIENKDKLI